ncbi:MAG: thiamine pyrophosphokinae [Thermoanaerobacteraceae bacterium]|jgi:thiamine pyrophosphokinase|uniref:Thiamine diphosphokinase n=1 Tax=Biomaibacter acetigenes TaxID=2316383 RepID=A0A3G2R3Q4_9FIRM|nr:thiamine diphosphokinase [Biomaibacter acetigenes]AYO30103.1 thiamine diphosphokinase [Biomaibacter acetigenes]MDK2879492.1 thiamine pyrophosphokinae [Thermoanaerobacteraceae bacterium]MDN5301223.1 thiamine pyrophosphokinae [Thermoanaerobacteraceae bacterium]MDN5313586.1 thiamine pyrophosphokinae [Thermoanaerobacteraceae bacterium]
MKAVIFAGGTVDDYRLQKKYVVGADIIICADSGVRHAFMMGITPDLVVGDMDSVVPEDLNRIKELGIEQETFAAEKDFTDTELALEKAYQRGATEAVILGGIGDRPDHSLANILLMVNFKKRGLEIRLAGENWEMFLIEGQVQISGKKGDLLSLIPLSREVSGIETRGLYYPLKNETIPMGTSRGISNVFLGDEVMVRTKKGLLLAVKLART